MTCDLGEAEEYNSERDDDVANNISPQRIMNFNPKPLRSEKRSEKMRGWE